MVEDAFKFQSYLNVLTISKFRKSVSRLRLSSHRLFIETGRWHKPESIPINERKCIICNKLEDEYHFVLECISYNDLRKQFLPVYYWKRPNMFKFIELINTENENIIKRLGTFIHNAFTVRTRILYHN